jgi:hypothetical protein
MLTFCRAYLSVIGEVRIYNWYKGRMIDEILNLTIQKKPFEGLYIL